MPYSEWSDSDLEDFEYPDSADESMDDHSDGYDSDQTETLPCPECGMYVYEEAPSCPHCGCYITFSTSLWSGRHPWWIWLGAAGIIAVVLVLLFIAY
jgi:hypothetical protein